jgi:outer membrane protein OmpA-like peptidoglycan-associated protein
VEIKAVTFASDQSFAVGKAILSAEAKNTLKSFVQELNIKLLKKINITAYTDSRGSDAFNLRLSKARAHAVQNELKKLGVASRLIYAKGAGESNPIASNETEEGRAKNRRVDIKVDMFSAASPAP